MLMPGLFDDFFDEFTRPAKRIPAPIPQMLKTDVRESESGYTLDVEVPGYNKDDLTLELKEGYLNISATTRKDNNEEGNDGHYIRRERFIGTSSRSFYVGEVVKEEDIKAQYNNGILTIFVPKKEAQPEIPESKYIAIE